MIKDAETGRSFTKFAIIVAVYHSLDYLSDCLNSLEKLNYPVENFQIVVLDLDAINGLREFMKKFEHYRFRIAYFHPAGQVAPTSFLFDEVNLNRARNLAIKKFQADIYAFTESPALFCAHWSEQYQDFIHHCPDYARILVRDSDTLETVGVGAEGLLGVITPYGVNGSVNQAVLVDDIVELISTTKCPECGYDGATFRVHGRIENAQGKSCSSLFSWIY